MDRDANYPQKVKSFWISYNMKLKPDITLTTEAGMADVENFKYQAAQSKRNYLMSVGLSKRF